MIVFSIILFAVAVPFFIISTLIYKGNTNLIHEYHQLKVRDKTAYGKAFSKAFIIIPITLLISAIVALLGDSIPIVISSIVILTCGLLVSITLIIRVQKRYNNGIF